MEDYKGLKCPNPHCTSKPGQFKTGQQKKEKDNVLRPMTCKVCGTVFWTMQVPTGKVVIKNEHLTEEELAAAQLALDQAAATGCIVTAPVPATEAPAVTPVPETHPIPPTSILTLPTTLASLSSIPLSEVSGQTVRAFMDGDSVCVVRETFVNHHDSKAGFGATSELAVADLLSNEAGVQA